jgi:hypothetical protein
MIVRFLFQIGPMRLLLLAITLLLIVLAPGGDARESREGWMLVTNILIPALSPVVLMGLLLDALMSRVWMIDAEAPARSRYRHILWLNLAASGALVLAFVPYMRSLAIG